jgi:hypothetical protein
MGNQVSSNSQNDKPNKNLNGKNNEGKNDSPDGDNLTYFKDNYSSYRGLKTDELTDGQNGQSISDTSVGVPTADKTNTTEITQDYKIPTNFEWKEGGNVVYVTGSFSNWSQWFIMSRNASNGNFELVLELPKGPHQYKFIVDNQWKFSKNHPTCNDGKGNINNIIDTTNYVPPQKVLTEKITDAKEPGIAPATAIKKSPLSDYNEYIPKKNELNTDAPNIPHHYAKSFNIDNNTFQHQIGNKDYLIFTDKNLCSENNSFKGITVPPHVNL